MGFEVVLDYTPARVVLINDFATVRGGATAQARRLARGLVNAGLDVTFFSGNAPDATIDGAEFVSVGDKRLSEQRAISAAVSGLNNASAAEKLSRLIESTDTPETVYHVHGWCQVLSPAIFGALERVAHRVIFHAHDFSLCCPNIVYFDFGTTKTCRRVPLSMDCLLTNCDKRSYPQKVWRWIRHKRFYGLAGNLRRVAPVIAVHENMEPLLRFGGIQGPITPVRNTADAFLERPVRAERNKALVYVGQLFDFKGPHDFVRAAAEMSVPVTVIGEGPSRDEIERIRPGTEFTGWLSGDGLKKRLATARAIVVPTRGIEPFGLVIVEALKSGIPVVVSDGALLAAEVERKGAGLSYPAGDVGALKTCLSRVAADDDLVRKMSERAVECGASLCPSETDWLEQIMGVYSDTLRRASATPTHETQRELTE